jgi:hypothetical protein
MNTTAPRKQLMTSLAEIYSFHPCASGWRSILVGQGKTSVDNVLFPLIDTVDSNSVSDVCWLIGQRKIEIEICVQFARKCADSVAYLRSSNIEAYATDAHGADAYAADADAYAADAAAHAANAAIYAVAAADAAYDSQIAANKQFLKDCIQAFEDKYLN